jgi:hypothetical protein
MINTNINIGNIDNVSNADVKSLAVAQLMGTMFDKTVDLLVETSNHNIEASTNSLVNVGVLFFSIRLLLNEKSVQKFGIIPNTFNENSRSVLDRAETSAWTIMVDNSKLLSSCVYRMAMGIGDNTHAFNMNYVEELLSTLQGAINVLNMISAKFSCS